MIGTSERNFCLQTRTTPQRERFDPPKARRGFALRAQNVHRATVRAIRPTRCAQGLRMLKMRTAPQRERFDPPKVRRWFASHAQNVHRATARAIRPTQSAQRVRFACSKCAPRHSESDSTHPKCAEGSLRVLKMCAAPQRERSR